MKRGSIIGYDLSEDGCQISYYDEEQHEPQTMEVAADNYQIPLMIGKKDNLWVYGREARRMEATKNGETATRLFSKAINQEKVWLEGKSYTGLALLTKFIELTLQPFEKIEYIVFTVPDIDVDIAQILKGIGQRIGIPKDAIYVQDYKESFCHYMFYQPKELWQYESALFYCDRNEVRAYMLRRLKAGFGKGKEQFVTVDEVANAQMKELSAIYPVLNVDKAKDADEKFKRFIQSVFEKKLISSVFLTGEGFENNWYPNSLKVLCNGRRAFIGNNLYSKGSCYTAYRRSLGRNEWPVYLDDTKLTEQVCIRLRVDGEEVWYPIVPWGAHWYESDRQWEILLENNDDIELHIESLERGEMEVITVPLDGLPDRRDYTLRLQVETLFLNEEICKVIFRDIGFGEFFEPSDFQTEVTIHLGGNHGKFNSLS